MAAPTIWVMSADPEIRRLIALNLSKRGFHIVESVFPAPSPPASETPQLVIVDFNAGPSEAHDWEAAQALRQYPVARTAPMLLLLSAPPRAEQLGALQPARWLEKPLAVDTLLNVVRESLSRTGKEFPSSEAGPHGQGSSDIL